MTDRSHYWDLYLPPSEPEGKPILFDHFTFEVPLDEREARRFMSSALTRAKPWIRRLPKGSITVPTKGEEE